MGVFFCQVSAVLGPGCGELIRQQQPLGLCSDLAELLVGLLGSGQLIVRVQPGTGCSFGKRQPEYQIGF